MVWKILYEFHSTLPLSHRELISYQLAYYKKKLALVFSFATVLFHIHNRAAQRAFLLAYPPNEKINQ